MKYKMVVDSTIEEKAVAGTTVYSTTKSDYGMAADDTRITGDLHISVTLNSDGDYPFFTVPFDDVEKIK